MCAEVMNLVFY